MGRLFAIGDIHGCFRPFRKLIEEKIRLSILDEVVLLGDYIDRGSESKEVIDYIIKLQHEGFNITPLRGNHEQMILDACNDKDSLPQWILNRGDETLRSFGIDSLDELEARYCGFFDGLKYYHQKDNYLFVHAGFNDRISNPFEDEYHMIWRSNDKYLNPLLREKIIIHGHRVIPKGVCEERIRTGNPVINLDTGCVYSGHASYGRLTALELYSMNIYFV